MDKERLTEQRRQAADKVFAEYDFGDKVIKDSQSGWDDDNVVLMKKVWLETEGNSVFDTFVVIFKPGTAEVMECYLHSQN